MSKLQKIAIINYNAGNITSIENSLKKLNHKPRIINNGIDLISYNPTHIILPGVGAIGKTMETLKKLDFLNALEFCVIKKQSLFFYLFDI